jgi:hypothetical protein
MTQDKDPNVQATPADPPDDDGQFHFKDCALIAVASGRRATNLKELRDHLVHLRPDSLYYHFWGALLQPRFEEREYNNDFASWVRHGLHDSILAEQLAVVDPDEYEDMEDVRFVLLEYIEQRLDDSEHLQWMPASQIFEFMHSQIVVFDAATRAVAPRELAELIPHMPTSSMFYHFIDARHRTPERLDDFSRWLRGLGDAHQPLIAQLADIDPYFGNLIELREQLSTVFRNYFAESGS